MTEREQIEELRAEVDYLKKIVEEYERREEDIESAEKRAKERADEIVGAGKKAFDLEVDRLRLFKMAWDKRFAAMGRADRERAEKLNSLAVAIDNVMSGKYEYKNLSEMQKTDEARRLVDDSGDMIDGSDIYLGEGENRFSLDEVLNPQGDFSLEDLCREMGLMEDDK